MSRPGRTAGLQDAPLSVSEFAALPDEEGYRFELARGALVREPAPGPRHGNLAVRLAILLYRHGEEAGRGRVFVETGFTLAREPATVRVPDVAFVSAGRIPEEGVADRFWELGPDLAVEIVSPSNTLSEVQRKALDYLDAGTRIVWVVDPSVRTVTVYRSREEIRILQGTATLEGGEVLPDLSLRLEELFRGVR